MTITALANGVALLAATQLPAKAAPTFDLKSTTSMAQLVRGGGGGGGAGGWGGGGGRPYGWRWLGHMGGGGPSGHFASVGGSAGHVGRMGDHFSGGAWGGGRSARIARGSNFSSGSNWHGRNFAHNNWNGNWNGNWGHHHHHNRFFVGGPFWYGGGYYAYGYGDCGWLRRQAIITGGAAIRPACTTRQS